MKRSSRSRVFIGIIGLLVVLLVIVLGLLIHYATTSRKPCPSGKRVVSTKPSPTFLEAFDRTDGLEIGWYRYDGSFADLKTVVADASYQMFSTRVWLRQGSSPSVVAGDNNAQSTQFDEWLDAVLSTPNKGVQIELKSQEEIEPVLRTLASRAKTTSAPIWLKVQVLGNSPAPADFSRFSEQVNRLLPSAYLALEWHFDDGPGNYSKQMVKEMWALFKNSFQPTSIVVSADMVGRSWPNLRWLLEKSENITLTVTSQNRVASSWSEELAYELLTVRNDFDKARIFYNIASRQNLTSFRSLSVTAGSALHHFDVGYDAARITWAHAVNSREKLNSALEEGIMFLEADVLLRGQGTPEQTTIPVMAHPPATDSDITLAEWLDLVAKTDRGIKLDFKSIEALEPSMVLLNARRQKLQQPVWLNADILPGPNAAGKPRNATQFLNIVQNNFPQATLSLGWTTGWSNSAADEGYSPAMIDEMDAVCQPLEQSITLPVRAAAAKSSWCQLSRLLDQSRRYTLTIWTSSSDDVSQEDMNYVRRKSEKSRVYFDLPEDLMPDVNR